MNFTVFIGIGSDNLLIGCIWRTKNPDISLLSFAKDERRALEVERAKALQSDGYNPSEIARMMGYNSESSIRSISSCSFTFLITLSNVTILSMIGTISSVSGS